MTSKELTENIEKNVAETAKETFERRLAPAVDIFETEDALTLAADLPGVSKQGLRIGIEKGILTIEGGAPAAGEALHREFHSRLYHRHFELPDNLDLENVAAEFKDGVLTLTLPKAVAAKPRRIEVTVH